MRRLYGSYVVIPCKHDAGYDEKMNAIQAGIEVLIKKHKELNIEPDFDTLQFIIHESDYSKKSLDWYADEKGELIDDLKEVITVGIKYEAKTTKEIRDYMIYNGEETKPAMHGACFHGETWYRCPWCNKAFEFWDAFYENGFTKVEDKLYRHKNCGKLVTVM